MMRIPAPGTRGYNDLLRFIRADSLINEKYHKFISSLTEEIMSQFAEQGKDFDLEFANWQAEKYECTYLKPDQYVENGMYMCNNCGEYNESSVHDINHHTTCQKGNAKKWEELYSKDNEEEVM